MARKDDEARSGQQHGPDDAAVRRECPKCQGWLHERALRETGIRVDCCPTCRGMWFDVGELQKHVEAVEGQFVPPADAEVSPRRCPACRVPMTAFEYMRTGVEMDFCENCRGVWLDVGELKRLGEKPDASRGDFVGLLGRTIGELKFW